MKDIEYYLEQVEGEREKELIRLAYEARVPEAVPDMLKCKTWEEMDAICQAYWEEDVEIVPYMLKCKNWREMKQIHLAYDHIAIGFMFDMQKRKSFLNGRHKLLIEEMLSCKDWREMERVMLAYVEEDVQRRYFTGKANNKS